MDLDSKALQTCPWMSSTGILSKWISSRDDGAEVAKLGDAIRQKTQLKPKLNTRSANHAKNG